MMRLRTLLLGLGLGVVGCGSDDGGATPDGGVDAPAGDITAPQIVSSTPAANAMRVGVLSTFSVVFDEPLDPDSVTDSVSVLEGFMREPAYGTTSYDPDTRTLTFVPQHPLVRGSRYQLRLGTTITDLAGNAFAGATIAFNTNVNERTREVSRLTTGAIGGWHGFSHDVNGRIIKDLYYNGPGMDGIWFNGNDHISGRSDNTFTAEGGYLVESVYDPGEDGVLDTSDDVPYALTVNTYDGGHTLTGHTNYKDAGMDETWGTSDDSISNYYVFTWEGDRQTSRVTYSGPGHDGVWRTADDRVSDIFVWTYEADGSNRQVRYQPGPDELAFTADDIVFSRLDNVYTNGYITGAVRRTAGDDGTWLTADDGYASAFGYERNADGQIVDYKQISGPGDDGVWLTADDVVVTRNLYTYDANKLLASYSWVKGDGPDDTWFTPDDEILAHGVLTYDATGNRTTERRFGDAGPDGMWKTFDDRVTVEIEYDPAH